MADRRRPLTRAEVTDMAERIRAVLSDSDAGLSTTKTAPLRKRCDGGGGHPGRGAEPYPQ
ncbi:MAG TPA: hypothetical protein VGL48_13825 [Acidimicrobiales bacterium]|jgi:hypothetical protein